MAQNVYKIRNSDLAYLRDSGLYKKSSGNNLYLYYITDTSELKIFRGSAPEDYDAVICYTDSDRFIDTEDNRKYFVVDSSTLYNYSGGLWTVIFKSNIDTYNAIVADNAQRELVGKGEDLLDNNGLLGNGNVVIRDINKLVKGILSNEIVGNNEYIYFYSAFGNNIRISPSSAPGENLSGVLQLNGYNGFYTPDAHYYGIFSADHIDLDEGNISSKLEIRTDGDYSADADIIDDIEISYVLSSQKDSPVSQFKLNSEDYDSDDSLTTLQNCIQNLEYKYIESTEETELPDIIKISFDLIVEAPYVFSNGLENEFSVNDNILLPDNYIIDVELEDDDNTLILLGYPPYPYVNASIDKDSSGRKIHIEIFNGIEVRTE